MLVKNLTFSGGLILGAGLVYLFDPDRAKGKSPVANMPPALRCAAGVLGLVAVALGAKLVASRAARDASTTTAFDTDVPKYAWLR